MSVKKLISFYLFNLFISQCIFAQLELGLHYRLGNSDLIDQNNTGTLDSKITYCVGFSISKKVLSILLFRTEINYETKGAIFNKKDVDFNIPYLSVPICLGVYLFNDRLRILPGIYLATTFEKVGFKANTFPLFFYSFNKFDWGLTYYIEVTPFKINDIKIKINHTLSYGLVSAYDLEFSPRITFGHTNWIRNYKMDIGLSLTKEF
ncbi:MAG: outer membrane beta-barrel protein [Saprospiraceae bacterium]|nr:outer membrane beta-barrel protein [Saprospiraceae bacterium]